MKKKLVVLCTPNIYHLNTIHALDWLKKTNLGSTELAIVDNCQDPEFRHARTMQDYLHYATGAAVIFLDDDVLIDDPEWIQKLFDCSENTGAAIVGCTHTYPSGEVNHEGILVYKDGSTELLREKVESASSCHLVPAVSSAVMLVTDTRALCFDTAFAKYQQDVDICLSAWEKGLTVACTSDLKAIHKLGGYMSGQDGFRDLFMVDSERLQQKWSNFTSKDLYQKQQLLQFTKLAEQYNWEWFYNEASRLMQSEPEKAISKFHKIVTDCPFQWRRAGAYYHLYRLGENQQNTFRNASASMACTKRPSMNFVV